MSQKEAFIFGNGDLNINPKITKNEEDIIVALDGGYNHLLKYDIIPDLCIGDFDSIDINEVKCDNIIPLPVHKDQTDMMYAIEYLLDKGFKSFKIYGALGGKRISHTLANIQALAYLCQRQYQGIQAIMYNDDAKENIRMFQGPLEIKVLGHVGYKFSLFAYSEKVEGLYIQGAQYETREMELVNVNPIGVSNSFIENEITIRFNSGTLLLVLDEPY